MRVSEGQYALRAPVTSINSGDKDMIYRANSRHDAYTFSFIGMSAVASVVAQPIVPGDLPENSEIKAPATPAPAEQPRESWLRRATRRFVGGAAHP
jgi:hypothetical protein